MPDQKRQLAAIMFTDIVGYTALMGSDEKKAFEVLRKNRNIHKPIITKYQGKFLKEIGDGILASFDTASDAVRCAGVIQNQAKKEDIKLSIGIHLGEVVFEEGDVLGDGVNVASRLEEMAEAGCIYISGAIYNNVKNKEGIKTEFIEEKSLKNVEEPVKVYKVEYEEIDKKINEEVISVKKKPRFYYYLVTGILFIILLVIVWHYSSSKYKNQSIEEVKLIVPDRSIAVLPFIDLSPDRDQEYFCDGMLDEILMHLYKIGDLRVTSRTSVMGYKEHNMKIKDIAHELAVAHILEGSIRKSGNNLRITVQLIDSASDQHLWAETYDRELAEVFTIQSDIAQQIAHSLNSVINPQVKQYIEKSPTVNLEAYDLFLKGNEAYWSSWSPADKKLLYESIDYYQKAIELDENFSKAYTGLGRSYWLLCDYEPSSQRSFLINKSQSYLEKAIELDPYNGWAYAELAVALEYWEWDSTAIRSNLDRAIKLMPNDPNGYRHYFYYQLRLGNCEKMYSIMQNFKRFNNNIVHPYSNWNLWLLTCQGKYQSINNIYEEYGNGNMDLVKAIILYHAFIKLKNYRKALDITEKFGAKYPERPELYYFKGLLYAINGDRNLVMDMCDSLEYFSTKVNVPDLYFASIYAALKDKEKMYAYINKAITSRGSLVFYMKYFPTLIPYLNEPQFQEIQKKVWIPYEKISHVDTSDPIGQF